jgi:hypothetical protein
MVTRQVSCVYAPQIPKRKSAENKRYMRKSPNRVPPSLLRVFLSVCLKLFECTYQVFIF